MTSLVFASALATPPMKHYTKFNLFDPAKLEVPKMGMQVVSAECFHCGWQTKFPVPQSYVDWEVVAEQYRQGYEKMLGKMGRIIADIDVMSAGPNPVREYLANEWSVLLDDIKRDFEAPPESQ